MPETTIVLRPDSSGQLDEYGNFVISDWIGSSRIARSLLSLYSVWLARYARLWREALTISYML